MREGNWIDGRWAAPRAGDVFEPELRPREGAARDPWPRSSLVDLENALAGLADGWPAWKRLGRRGRARVLLERLDGWQRHAPGVDALALRLGLAHDDLDLELERGLERGDRVLEGRGGRDESGPVLVRVPGCELWEGLVGAVLGPLLGGVPVLLLGDRDLPHLAHEFVRALVEPDPEHPLASALALVHEDRSVCLEEALASGDLARAWIPGRADPDAVTPISGAAPRNASAVVLAGDDPLERAAALAAAAFAPVAALSGQRAGQLGRVFCHERRLSAFTGALLEQLEALSTAGTCRPFVGDLGATCEGLVRLGLDEGATLILGGPDGSAGFRGALRKGSVVPSVFTNVEPNMALARASRPAPVLSLVRLPSDAEAQAAVERADRPGPPVQGLGDAPSVS